MLKDKSIWLLASVFFVVGAMFCLNDVIFPHVKSYFGLSYFQATFIQLSFYITYLFVPIPTAKMVNAIGYRNSVSTSIATCIVGCLLFIPAYLYTSFVFVLIAIFILSSGITIINVAANPYATLLGSSEQAQLRINFVQVFSRIGYAVTPILGNSLVMVKPGVAPTIHLPYILLSALFAIIFILIPLLRMPHMKPENKESISFVKSAVTALSYKHLSFGILAMFFYVGAEACTASFFINYLTDKNLVGMQMDEAALYLAYFNVAAGVMGFASIYLLKITHAGRLLFLFGIVSLALCSFNAINTNSFTPVLMVMLGGCMAMMFPTVYGLAIQDLGTFTNEGAALVSAAIVGGAFFPPLQGLIADEFGIGLSYFIPAVCFGVVACYGFTNRWLKTQSKF